MMSWLLAAMGVAARPVFTTWPTVDLMLTVTVIGAPFAVGAVLRGARGHVP